MSEETELTVLRIRLKAAESALIKVCTLQVQIGGRDAPWDQVMSWRIEMAREYCDQYGLLSKPVGDLRG